MAAESWNKVAWGTGAAAITAAALALPGLWQGDTSAKVLGVVEPRLRAVETTLATLPATTEALLLRRQIDAGKDLQAALEGIGARLGAIERRLDAMDARLPRPPR